MDSSSKADIFTSLLKKSPAGFVGVMLFIAVLVGSAGGFLASTVYREPIAKTFGISFSPNTDAQKAETTSSLKTDRDPEESAIIRVAHDASPAVVSIVVSKEVAVIDRSTRQFNPFGIDFPFSITVPREKSSGKTTKQVIGGGSGFFVSADGYILTNRHVVADTNATYMVVTTTGKELPATVLDRDPVNDLAVLRVTGTDFPTLAFSDSDTIDIGQRAIAIGYALGQFKNSVSVGVVSGLDRNIQAGGGFNGQSESLDDLIQTDAAINHGNSGGPLLDTKGEVIGVNVAVADGSQNIGFAIPVNAVKPVLLSVQKYGHIVRPQLGVRYTLITPEFAVAQKLTVDHGALISAGSGNEPAVLPGSPAEKAGLVSGDIIIAVDGVKVDDGHSLGTMIINHSVGDSIVLTVEHGTIEKHVKVILEEWKSLN